MQSSLSEKIKKKINILGLFLNNRQECYRQTRVLSMTTNLIKFQLERNDDISVVYDICLLMFVLHLFMSLTYWSILEIENNRGHSKKAHASCAADINGRSYPVNKIIKPMLDAQGHDLYLQPFTIYDYIEKAPCVAEFFRCWDECSVNGFKSTKKQCGPM